MHERHYLTTFSTPAVISALCTDYAIAKPTKLGDPFIIGDSGTVPLIHLKISIKSLEETVRKSKGWENS